MVKHLILTILILLQLPVLAKKPKPPIPGKWKLVLNEEFNEIDTKRWTLEPETNHKLNLSQGLCFFSSQNVRTLNGNLLIVSQKGKIKKENANGKIKSAKYSSGYIHSFRKFRQRYGYFETRMKLPSTKGLWPAFWLMPDRSKDSTSPLLKGMRSTHIEDGSKNGFTGKGMEIDIMEHLTEWDDNRFHYAAHWDGFGDDLKSYSGSYKTKVIPEDGYHKFGLYWAKDLLVWYVDDEEVTRLESDRVADVPMYIIFSTNMGGWATDKIDNKALPAYTYVDYVRVWE
jgi:beta-glucanase (GH16 family)